MNLRCLFFLLKLQTYIMAVWEKKLIKLQRLGRRQGRREAGKAPPSARMIDLHCHTALLGVIT